MKANRRQTHAEQRHASLSRRHFLRGLGACVALPAFHSLLPAHARAAAALSSSPLATTASGAPLRMAFVYFPNGVHQANWWPTGSGRDYQPGRTMQPIAALKDQFQILGGLDHLNATAGNDGAGDHARANATFLTGARARKTDGTDVRVGVSIDQLAAQHVGHQTRFSSLELTCDNVRKSGRCDSGYSCAYQYNISWQSESSPVAPEGNPRLVFERLFGSGDNAAERQLSFQHRKETQKSLLDFILDDANTLSRELDYQDRHKLDEYLSGVREIEQRIERSEQFGDLPDPAIDTPAGVPPDFGEHMRLIYDLLAMAFETDSTRVATLLLSGDGNNRPYPQIGIPEGHHYCSHHKNNGNLIEKIGEIDQFYMRHFAGFLDRLAKTKDVDGNSVLHNSMIVYGCGNSDGNRHTHVNLPIILAGAGGGSLEPGRFVNFGSAPMSNVLLSLAHKMGVRGVNRFGDSTGPATGI